MVSQGKNVLYISYDGMTDPLGQAQVLPYLIGLKKYKHNIFLLSAEKHENYSVHAAKIQQICKENQIHWHPIFYRKKPPVLSTILDINTLWKNAKKIITQNNVQIVHCRSYISAFIGLKAQKKLNCKFIFDMRGFWADERIEGNIWKLSNPIHKRLYDFFKKKSEEITEKGKKLDLDLQARAKGFEQEVAMFQQTGGNLTQNQIRAKQDELMQKEQNLVNYRDNLMRELSTDESTLLNDVYLQVQEFMKEYAKENGIDLILSHTRGGAIWYATDAIDVTKSVTEGLNKKYNANPAAAEKKPAAADSTAKKK